MSDQFEDDLAKLLGGEQGEQDRMAWVPCPVGLLGEYENQWRQIQLQLIAQGSWRIIDAYILKAMLENRRQADELKETARGEPVVVGSTGNAVANPLFAVILNHERMADAQGKLLKVPPLVRDGLDAEEEDTGPKDEFAALEAALAPAKQPRGTGAGRGGAKGGRKRKPPG